MEVNCDRISKSKVSEMDCLLPTVYSDGSIQPLLFELKAVIKIPEEKEMKVTNYREENPEEWAESISLFAEDLREFADSPQDLVQIAALSVLELRSGETIADALKAAERILGDN